MAKKKHSQGTNKYKEFSKVDKIWMASIDYFVLEELMKGKYKRYKRRFIEDDALVDCKIKGGVISKRKKNKYLENLEILKKWAKL